MAERNSLINSILRMDGVLDHGRTHARSGQEHTASRPTLDAASRRPASRRRATST